MKAPLIPRNTMFYGFVLQKDEVTFRQLLAYYEKKEKQN